MHRFDDPARAIRVAPGEVFAIALAGNPTTGYTWQTDFGADRANVRAGRSRCRSWSTGGVPFSGCGRGTIQIAFVYQRHWGGEPHDAKHFRVVIA